MERSLRLKRKRAPKIVSLHGATYAKGLGSDAGVVSMLQDLLARAKKGEIIGFTYGAVEAGGRTEDGCAVGRAGRHYLVSCASQMYFNFMQRNCD